MSRLETGPVQCGDDWPGIFIRGDDALKYAMTIRQVCKHSHLNWVSKSVLEGLAETLEGCMVQAGKSPEPSMIEKTGGNHDGSR